VILEQNHTLKSPMEIGRVGGINIRVTVGLKTEEFRTETSMNITDSGDKSSRLRRLIVCFRSVESMPLVRSGSGVSLPRQRGWCATLC
jgi:hypothetical protein